MYMNCRHPQNRIGLREGWRDVESNSDHTFDCVGIEIENENFDEEHFLARILEDHFGIFGITTKNVRCKDHGEIIHVHLRDDDIFRSSKDLQETSRHASEQSEITDLKKTNEIR